MTQQLAAGASELRDQIVTAGLGARLANTWRGEVYPKSRDSMNPAGYIHSAAPAIIESYVRGAEIVPVNGSRYLAIPTDAVPRKSGRGGQKRMSVFDVEQHFNQDLIIRPGRAGHLLGFIDPGRGSRRARSVKIGRTTRKLVLMFTFVRSVRKPKLLDLNEPALRGAGAFEGACTTRLG